jgi:hypothetical protein
MNVFKIDPLTKNLGDAFTKVLSSYPAYLREDAFFVSLVCSIFVFQETEGISCPQLIQEERNILIQLLDIYIRAKLQEWDVTYDSVWDVVQTILLQANNYRTKQVFEKFASDRQRILDCRNTSVSHPHIWLKSVTGSSLEYNSVLMDMIPAVFIKIVLEIKVKDGMVLHTNQTLRDLIITNNNSSVQFYSDSETLIDFKSRDGHQTVFTLLENDDFTKETFDVEVKTSSSVIKSFMMNMTQDLWWRLNQVISCGSSLRNIFYTTVSTSSNMLTPTGIIIPHEVEQDVLTASTSNASTITKRLTLNFSWQTILKPVFESFEQLCFFKSLPIADQDILRRESSTEVTLVQMFATCDKASESFVFNGLRNHLLLGVQIKTFEVDKPFYHGLRTLFLEADDILRKDEVVTTILCILCLFKDRVGVSCKTLIQQERSLYFKLLDNYIRAKTNSNDWITPYDVIWERIHRDLDRVASQRILFENLSVDVMKRARK